MQMRVPYKKLIEEFAANFFSRAVMCTMTENIKTLDRNNTYAKEKDVFQDESYRAHLMKEADEKKALDVINKAIKKKKAEAAAAEG